MAAVTCGILTADSAQVVWLSDGGRGFWRLFREVFTGYATPVLDFYHALKGKGIKPWLDGRTKTARDYFRKARRLLKRGEADSILADLDAALQLKDLPPTVRKKLLRSILRRKFRHRRLPFYP